MTLADILALLQAIPAVFSAAESIKADLGTTDLATLNAAIATAQASATTDIAKAEADLNAAQQ